jgi:predicted TIM-barrel fold metal-dependent hydrolase
MSCLLVLLLAPALWADEDQGIVTSEMVWVEKTPKSYPVVNCHWHLGATEEDFDLAVKVMDATGVAVSVDLGGGTGERLQKKLELARKYPGRFVIFCGFSFREEDSDDPDIGLKLAASLEESVKAGAVGCGEMGHSVVHGYHTWDDPRLEPFWEKAIELKVPLNWHAGQPARYWRPESPYNRLEGDSLYGKMPKCQHAMLRDRDRVLDKYPDLVVIAPHSSYAASQVPYLIYLMETYPNLYIDIDASLEEWGRRPYEFYDFCIEYQDRILYGTDWGVYDSAVERSGSPEKFIEDWKAFAMAHYLFLGTDQRMIPVPFNGNGGRYLTHRVNGFPRYAHDGANLPEEVLEKIYYKNAERLFGIKVEGWKPPKPPDPPADEE